MNDVQPPTTDQVNAQPAPPKGGSIRLIILLLVLVVALGGLLYDYQVARPAVDKARVTLEKALDGTTKDPDGDGTFSMQEVHQLLGREPDQVDTIEGGKKETYLWRSGMPFRQYKLVVAYWGTQTPLLNSFAINSALREDQLPPKGNMQVEELTEEQRENFKPLSPMGAGMGGGAKKGNMGGDRAPDAKKKSPPRKRADQGGGGGSMSAVVPPADQLPTDTKKPAASPDKQKDTKTEPAQESKPEARKPAETKNKSAAPTKTPPAKQKPEPKKPAEKKG